MTHTTPLERTRLYRVEVPATLLVGADSREWAREQAALQLDAAVSLGHPLARITRIRSAAELRPEEAGERVYNAPEPVGAAELLARFPAFTQGEPDQVGHGPVFDALWAELGEILEDGGDDAPGAFAERLYRVRIPFRALVVAADAGDALWLASTDAAYEVAALLGESLPVERIVGPGQLRERERARTVPGFDMPAWAVAEVEEGAGRGDPRGDTHAPLHLDEPDLGYRLTDEQRAQIRPPFDPDAVERLLQRADPEIRPFLTERLFLQPDEQGWSHLSRINSPVLQALLDEAWQPFWEGYPDHVLEDASMDAYPGRHLALARRRQS